jgi:hypothetical protein
MASNYNKKLGPYAEDFSYSERKVVPLRTTGRVEVQLQPFYTSSLEGGQWSTWFVPPDKESPVPLTKMFGGTQSRSGRFGETKNFFALSGIEPRLLCVT